MLSELIRIQSNTLDEETLPTVNARDLHAFLEVGKMFAHWIKDRIEQLRFVENQDFIILAEIGKYSGRGQPKKEYHLTLDMAKHLAMIERNAKGHARAKLGCQPANFAGLAERSISLFFV